MIKLNERQGSSFSTSNVSYTEITPTFSQEENYNLPLRFRTENFCCLHRVAFDVKSLAGFLSQRNVISQAEV